MKMHGLGNDFVVIDARVTARAMTAELARALADRNRGVGFDQLAVIEPDEETDLKLTFFNADGSLSAACGNATRCIARHEMEVRRRSDLSIRTERGILQARDAGDGLTSVNMGHPSVEWADIPHSEAADTLHLPIGGDPVGTSMDDRVRVVNMANSLIALGQGVPFFHAGQDLLRSKSSRRTCQPRTHRKRCRRVSY